MTLESDKKIVYLLAFFSPIIGLYTAIRYRYESWAKNLCWIFCSFTGLVIIYSFAEGYDIYRYAMQLKDFYNSELGLLGLARHFFAQENVDVYQFTLVFFVSRFTDNAHLLFLFYAIIYGFFYSRNIWYLYEKKNNSHKSYHIGILILYFASVWPIWQIAGARFGTAFHLFMYGIMPYLLDKNTNKLPFVFLSAFVHFSFLFPIALFLLSLFIPRNQYVALIFYVITLFIKEINLSAVNEFLNTYLPSFLHNRVDIYANEEYYRLIKEATYSFHVIFMNDVGYIVTQILLFSSFYILIKFLKDNIPVNNLFFFSLFVASFSNIASLIPNGERFLSLSQMFIISSVIFIFSELEIDNLYRKRIIPITLLLLIPIVFKIRVGCDYYGFSLFGNYITAFFIEDNTPFIEFIK